MLTIRMQTIQLQCWNLAVAFDLQIHTLLANTYNVSATQDMFYYVVQCTHTNIFNNETSMVTMAKSS